MPRVTSYVYYDNGDTKGVLKKKIWVDDLEGGWWFLSKEKKKKREVRLMYVIF